MAERSKVKQRSALKHGAYSTIGLLPGEGPALFKKLQKIVVDELTPNGPVELDIVLTIARLLWRKQNLASFETAKLLNFRYRQILEEEKKSRGYSYCRMFAKGENHALDQSGRPARARRRRSGSTPAADATASNDALARPTSSLHSSLLGSSWPSFWST